MNPTPDPAAPTPAAATTEPAAVLRAAADLLEQRARLATPGPWEIETGYLQPHRAQGLFISCDRDGIPCERLDCIDGTHGIGGFDGDPDNRWAALVHPGIAAPLAAWLRMAAEQTELANRLLPGPLLAPDGVMDIPLTLVELPLALAHVLLGHEPHPN